MAGCRCGSSTKLTSLTASNQGYAELGCLILYKTVQGCAAGIGILFVSEIIDKVCFQTSNYMNSPTFQSSHYINSPLYNSASKQMFSKFLLSIFEYSFSKAQRLNSLHSMCFYLQDLLFQKSTIGIGLRYKLYE